MRIQNLIFLLIKLFVDSGYSQSPFIDPLVTTTLLSSSTADIICILHSDRTDLKSYTDHLNTKKEREMIPLHSRKQSLQDGWGETGIDECLKEGMNIS